MIDALNLLHETINLSAFAYDIITKQYTPHDKEYTPPQYTPPPYTPPPYTPTPYTPPYAKKYTPPYANQYTLPYAEDWKLDVAGSPSSFGQGKLKLKRGLSGTIDGLEVSALADTGAAQNVVSSNFARAQKFDVAGSPSSFRQGNSTLAHSLGTSKYGFDTMTKRSMSLYSRG